MKKLWNILVLTLAMNFAALAGGVAWLYATGRLDPARVKAIKEVLFPAPAVSVAAATTQPEATTQPTLKLEELLAQRAGRPVGEQVEYIRQTFDTQMAQLDHRHRELLDLMAQIDLAKKELTKNRAALEADRARLDAQRQEARKLATDQGFQDSLNLYGTMSPKQVKTIFMTLGEDAVVTYLRAMPARTASRIVKEFKAPEELERIQRIMERMRQAEPTTRDAADAADAGAAADNATSDQPPGAAESPGAAPGIKEP